MTSMMKTIKLGKKKLKKMPDDGKNSLVYDGISWKWIYYQKLSIDSMQCPSKFQCQK
jgi:hypothetical protein